MKLTQSLGALATCLISFNSFACFVAPQNVQGTDFHLTARTISSQKNGLSISMTEESNDNLYGTIMEFPTTSYEYLIKKTKLENGTIVYTTSLTKYIGANSFNVSISETYDPSAPQPRGLDQNQIDPSTLSFGKNYIIKDCQLVSKK